MTPYLILLITAMTVEVLGRVLGVIAPGYHLSVDYSAFPMTGEIWGTSLTQYVKSKSKSRGYSLPIV